MPDENFSGDAVVDSAADALASAPDTDSQPKTNVWASIQDGTNTVETVQDPPASDEEAAADDADAKIPAEEAAAADKDEPAEEKPKNRAQNFKELQTKNQTLEETLSARETEVSSLNEKLTTLDQALEAYGGVEQVGTFIETQNKFIDPARYKELVDDISGLPQASAVYGEMLNRSFNLGDVQLTEAQAAKAEANRVEVVNSALAKDFGLTERLSLEEMSAAFQWLAIRANKDKADLLSDIKDEIELLQPDDGKKIDPETKKRLDELEKQVLEQKQSAKKSETPEAETLDREKITTILNDYESDVIETVAADVLKDYATTLDKLSPYKAKAIKALVRQELGAGQTFIQLADYLITDRKHSNAKFLDGQYRNQVKTLIRSAALEILGKPSAAPTPPTQPGLTPKGKTNLQPQKGKDKPNVWGEILNQK